MTPTQKQPRPKSVEIAIRAIWVTNVATALVMLANYDEASMDTLVINGQLLLVYVIVTLRISAGSHRARLVYAFLVALEVAILLAFGLSEATDLELLLTYLTLPLEAWILVKLFGAESDKWFAVQKMKPPPPSA